MDKQVLIWAFGGDKPGEKLGIVYSSEPERSVHISHKFGDGSGKIYEEELWLSKEAARELGRELRMLEVIGG